MPLEPNRWSQPAGEPVVPSLWQMTARGTPDRMHRLFTSHFSPSGIGVSAVVPAYCAAPNCGVFTSIAISLVGCAAPFGNLAVFPAIPALDGFFARWVVGRMGLRRHLFTFSRRALAKWQNPSRHTSRSHRHLNDTPGRYLPERRAHRGPLLSMNFAMGMGLRWVFGRCRQLIAPLITGLSIMPFSTYQLVAICL